MTQKQTAVLGKLCKGLFRRGRIILPIGRSYHLNKGIHHCLNEFTLYKSHFDTRARVTLSTCKQRLSVFRQGFSFFYWKCHTIIPTTLHVVIFNCTSYIVL